MDKIKGIASKLYFIRVSLGSRTILLDRTEIAEFLRNFTMKPFLLIKIFIEGY